MNIQVAKETFKARPKTFVLVLVLFVANICLFAYAAMYQKPRLVKLQGTWFEKRKVAASGGSADDYRQTENDLKAWRDRIVPKKDFAKFLGNLFETAAHNSLAFKGVTYKLSQVKEENLVAYVLDFNVTGKYAGVKSFISDLGRMREIVTIDNLSLNNSNVIGDAVDMKVQMTLYLRLEGQ